FLRQAVALNVGDPAPGLAGLKWIKGAAVTEFVAGQVYVVEFWATWCGGCIANVPLLNQLARKYEGKGTFIGIDTRETANADRLDQIPRKVNRAAETMEYRVAMDDPATGAAGKAWNVGPIPASFIVDDEGRIAFMHVGGPVDALDLPLSQLLAGTLNTAK